MVDEFSVLGILWFVSILTLACRLGSIPMVMMLSVSIGRASLGLVIRIDDDWEPVTVCVISDVSCLPSLGLVDADSVITALALGCKAVSMATVPFDELVLH